MALSALEMLSRHVETDFDDGLGEGGGYWNVAQGDEPGVFEIFTEEYVEDDDGDGVSLALGQRWRVTVEEITG